MNQKARRWEEDGLVRMGMSDEEHVNVCNLIMVLEVDFNTICFYSL